MANKGPFAYTKVNSLEGKPKVFKGSCAGLVQWYTRVGLAKIWREGIAVKGNGSKIKKGTTVATFVNGRYPNKPFGKHAALTISQSTRGVYVMDQWKSKPTIGKRLMRFKGKGSNVAFVDPSNNGSALSVILHE